MNLFVAFFSRPLALRRFLAVSAFVMVISQTVTGYSAVSISNMRISVDQQPMPSILCTESERAYLAGFPAYRLRAKLHSTNQQLATGLNNYGQPLDFFPAGVVGTQPVALYWVTYSDAAGTQNPVPGPEVTAYFTVVPTNVLLTNYTTTPSPLPHILTTEPMSPVFKLRSKVIGVPGFADGFHAALSWNNQNKELDQSPPPGTYLNQLYWIKYAADGSTITTIGQFLDTTLKVTQGTIALTSYYFKTAQPAAIFTDEPMPDNYRLRAIFSGTTTATPSITIANFSAATSGNNNGFLLDRLPPEGVYEVRLYWEKLDVAGNVVSGGTGPTTTKTVTIYAGSSDQTYAGLGEITEESYDDDEGNPQNYFSGGQYHHLYVPTAGTLTIATTGPVDTYGYLYGPTWNWLGDAQGGGEGGYNFSRTLTVQAAGWYHLWIEGNNAGNYVFSGSFVASAASVSTPVATGASGITPTQFVATWSMASGADGYELDVSTSSYFNHFVFQQLPVTGLRYAVTAGLSPASNYYYRVRATNHSGAKSAWSAVMQATTAPNLPAYQAATEIDARSARLNWGGAIGVPQSVVSYSTSSAFPIALTTTLLFDNTTTSTTILTGLTPNTRYYYQVGSVGQYGAISALPTATFTTLPAAPVQLALKSWQANDRPDVVVSEYAQVWVEGSEGGGWSYDATIDENFDWSSWDGGMSDLTDPDGNNQGSIPSCFSVSWHQSDPSPGYWDSQWVTDVFYPDGISGSSWLTTRGSFPKDSPVSGYNVGTKDRLYLLPSYRPGEAITFQAWNVVPDANCNTCQAKLYGPRIGGVLPAPLYTSPIFSAGDRWQCTFVPSGQGVYQVDISYLNASHTTPASGTVTYLIAVGPPVVAEMVAPTSPVSIGSNVTFTVVATGNPSYVWKKGGNVISGANSATLSLANVQATSAGTYTVEMTNADGTTSRAVTLAIGAGAGSPPVITMQPVSVTVPAGQSALFAVEAVGTAPFSYQWKKGGSTVGNASTLILNNVQLSASGNYFVTITNSDGSVDSQLALLIVATATDSANDAKLKVYAPISP